MAWTAPLTWTPNSAVTAAQLNVHVRDNMLETEAAKATGDGGYMVATNPNAITERQVQHDEIVTSETTTNTAFVNLATTGPTCVSTVGPQALALWSVQYSNNGANNYSITSIALSGANTSAADDSYAAARRIDTANYETQHMHHLWYTGLISGSTTFQLKYRVTAGTGTFARRRLIVLPY